MLKIHTPAISYSSVSVNLLRQLNATGTQPTSNYAKNQPLPGLQSSPSTAVSAIMRILVASEGLKASLGSTGNALGMEVERFEFDTGYHREHIAQVRAVGSGDLDLSVISSSKDYISAGAAGGNDTIQVVGHRTIGVTGQNGNDHISVIGLASDRPGVHYDPTVDVVDGGDGNDTIAIASQGRVSRTSGGDGNDAIAITARGLVDVTSGGDGNDAIAVSTTGRVDRLEGGDGNDAIAISAGGDVDRIYGGDGRDAIAVSTRGSVSGLYGGDCDDVINITADNTSSIDGGDGDDVIRVTAKWSANASGGDGNDVLQLAGREIWASGGTGNDRIKLDSTSGHAATLRMAEGDGNDVVETNAPLNIARYSGEGATRLDPAKATLTRNDDGTVTVRFEGSNDSVTVKFTGAMAGREIVAKVENGSLLIGPANS